MSEPDVVARVISLLSTVLALASLSIAVLSHRRGRPRVVVRDARVITAVQSPSTDEADSGDEVLLVQALLVNRGQAKVQLASGARSDAWPLAVEFQRPRAPRRLRRSKAGRVGDQTLVASLADRLENDQVDGFSGLAVSGELPNELVTRAMTARLWRMRARITLSSGDVIFSHWFPTPSPWEALVRGRRAQLRQEALPAMNDLALALQWWETADSQHWVRLQALASKTGLKSAVVNDLLNGRREPTWPVIAKIVDALSTDFILVRPRLEHWKAKWAASLDAGKWDNESPGGSR